MSFAEYLHLRAERIPDLRNPIAERDGHNDDAAGTHADRRDRRLVPAFHEYLLRGGFPRIREPRHGTACFPEDIVDKVLAGT